MAVRHGVAGHQSYQLGLCRATAGGTGTSFFRAPAGGTRSTRPSSSPPVFDHLIQYRGVGSSADHRALAKRLLGLDGAFGWPCSPLSTAISMPKSTASSTPLVYLGGTVTRALCALAHRLLFGEIDRAQFSAGLSVDHRVSVRKASPAKVVIGLGDPIHSAGQRVGSAVR